MTHKDKVISFLSQHNSSFCDDCLSEKCNITPRQTVFLVCSKLYQDTKLYRFKSACSICGKTKTVNQSVHRTTEPSHEATPNSIKVPALDKKLWPAADNELSEKLTEVQLVFTQFGCTNVFAKFYAHTVWETLQKVRYVKHKHVCADKYGHYLDMALGPFLHMLKINGDSFYKDFLNPYGDLTYCEFKMKDSNLSKRKGIYVFKLNGEIKYIGRVQGNLTFSQRINAGYGLISPKNCYIDGQATNCHVNALINEVGDNVRLHLLPLDDDEEICSLERSLISTIQPEWNIALK
ncbi:MAG: hypothetical protein M0Z55_08570 [Peptococcaceae bacterium]|nr:hypothetical protein [Peptococcaceae bacterium]